MNKTTYFIISSVFMLFITVASAMAGDAILPDLPPIKDICGDGICQSTEDFKTCDKDCKDETPLIDKVEVTAISASLWKAEISALKINLTINKTNNDYILTTIKPYFSLPTSTSFPNSIEITSESLTSENIINPDRTMTTCPVHEMKMGDSYKAIKACFTTSWKTGQYYELGIQSDGTPVIYFSPDKSKPVAALSKVNFYYSDSKISVEKNYDAQTYLGKPYNITLNKTEIVQLDNITEKSYYWDNWKPLKNIKDIYPNFNSKTELIHHPDIGACGTISAPGTYTLNQSFNTSSTCITINTNNVTLDGNGFIIDGDDSGTTDYGIYASGRNNITIKNFANITDFFYGIYFFTGTNNSIINNITANSNSNGLYLSSSSNNNILTNITANYNTYGFYLDSSSNGNIITNITANSNSLYGLSLASSSNNNLSSVTANSNSEYGLYLYYSSNNIITNITANNNLQTGLYLDYSSNGNIIQNINSSENKRYDLYLHSNSISDCNNQIINVTGSGGKPIEYYNSSVTIQNKELSGLILCNADNSIINNINITGSSLLNNSYLGVYYTDNSSFRNINSSNNYYGFYLYSSSTNSFTNITANSNSQYGLYLYSRSNNNIISSVTANSNTNNGLYLSSSSNNNILTNITANSNGNGLYLYSSSNNTISSITANSNTYRGLFLDSSSNNNLSSVTANSNSNGLSLTSSSNNNIISSVTANSNSNGLYLSSSSNNNILTNITANYNTYGFYLDSSSNNILTNITANSNTGTGLYLYSSSNNNILTNITANSNSQYGLYLQTSSNNILTNITANSNGNGLYLSGSLANTFTDITANSNQYGLYLSGSLANTFTDITANSNTNIGIYIDQTSKVNEFNGVADGNSNYDVSCESSDALNYDYGLSYVTNNNCVFKDAYIQRRIYLITVGAGSWVVPADWNNNSNTIEAIGGGAGSSYNYGGGGGGEYQKIINFSASPGSAIPYIVGAGGIGCANGDDSTFNTNTLVAKGGFGPCDAINPSLGGYGGTGDVGYKGGDSNPSICGIAGYGGGGAGGPNGAGGNGGACWFDGSNLVSGGGGGGNGGGSNGNDASSSGGNGGEGTNGTTGSDATGSNPGAGGANGGGGGGGGVAGTWCELTDGGEGGYGHEWDLTYGSGGGGGAGGGDSDLEYCGVGSGGSGGLYGGGAGGSGYAGGQGIIVITYASAPPTITNIKWITTGGFTDDSLTYSQILDEINATCSDSGTLLSCNLTLTSPSTTIVDNLNLTNSGTNYNYSTDILLNEVGTWNVTFKATNDAGLTTTASDTFTVSTVNQTLINGYFGYDTQDLPSNSTLTDLAAYDYNLIEIRGNATEINGNWTNTLLALQKIYSLNMKSGLAYYLDYNLSSNTSARTSFIANITSKFPTLLNTPYIQSINYIKFYINNYSYTDQNITDANLDLIAKAAYDATTNEFAIFANYNSSTLDGDYFASDGLIYITGADNASLINRLANLSRYTTSRTRIYYGLGAQQKLLSQQYQDTIMVPLLDDFNSSTRVSSKLVSELQNGQGLVIYNNNSAVSNFTYNVSNASGIIGKDVWDYTNGLLLANNSNGTVTFLNIAPYSAILVGFEDVNYVAMTTDTNAQVHTGTATRILNSNYTDGTREGGSAGSNSRAVELWDKSYTKTTSAIYYGWLNSSGIINPYAFDGYKYLVIADKNNVEIDKLFNGSAAISKGVFGYIAVADYTNGTTKCSNTTWVARKKTEVDNWLALNGSLNIFIDGFDIGNVKDTGCFFTDVKNVTDYISITKGRQVGVNVFTNYQEFAPLATPNGFAMIESCTHKWFYYNNSNSSYNYTNQYWSDFNGYGDFNKSIWYSTHNIPVICVPFIDRNSSSFLPDSFQTVNKDIYHNSTYELMQKLWFKAKVLGYDDVVMGHPLFNILYNDYYYDVGTDLQSQAFQNNDLYYRLYSKGTVYYNSTSDKAWFEDGRTYTNLTAKVVLFDDTAHTYSICVNNNCSLSVTTPGDGWSYDWYTLALNQNLFNASYGHYVINISSSDGYVGDDQTYSTLTSNGKHSFYYSGGWNAEADATGNHMFAIEITDSYSNIIDSTNKITQTNATTVTSYTKLGYINLTSAYEFATDVWTNVVQFTQTKLNDIKVWTGSNWASVSYNNDSACITAAPNWFNNNVLGIGNVGVCIYTGDGGFKVRLKFPKLSTQQAQMNFDDLSSALTVNSPLNNSNYNSTSVLFNISLNEEGSWCGLSLDGSANITMGNYSSTDFNFTNSSMSVGRHNVTFTCNDTGNNFVTSGRYDFLVDNIYPNISFTSQTPGNNTIKNTVVVNVSSSDNLGEHSTFVDWNNSLIGWWRLEQENGTFFTDSSSYLNNGTCTGCPSYTTIGKHGGGYNFNGSNNNYISLPNINNIGSYASISFWAKTNGSYLPEVYSAIYSSGFNSLGHIMIHSSGYIYWAKDTTTARYENSFTANKPFSNNNWHHITLIYNGTNASEYIDGTFAEAKAMLGTFTNTASYSIIGQYNIAGLYSFNGTIDDLMIFSRALSAAEVASLYNATQTQYNNSFTSYSDGNYTYKAYAQDLAGNINQTETRYVTLDKTYPSIQWGLNTDGDNYNYSRLWIYSNVTFTETNFQNITWDISGTTQTYTIPTYAYNATIASDGEYKYNATICDAVGLCNTTSTRTITLDTTAPSATLASPSDLTNTSSTTLNLTASFTDNLGIKNITLYLRNQTTALAANSTSFSPSTLSVDFGFNRTLPDGKYKWHYGVYDWAGNAYNSSANNFTIDTTAPSVNMTSPTDNLSQTAMELSFNYTVTDATTGVKNCSLLIDGTSVNNSFSNYTYTFLTTGSYEAKVTCRDYVGNEGSSATYTITITSAGVTVTTGGGGSGNYVTTVLSNETPFLSYNYTYNKCPETNIFNRILSSCKFNNSYCDDGENPIIDKDCTVTGKEFASGQFFKSMWVIRLLIAVGIILLVTKRRQYLIFVGILLATLLIVNGAFTLPQATTTDTGFIQQFQHNLNFITEKIDLDWKVIIPIILAFYLFVIYPKKIKRRY